MKILMLSPWLPFPTNWGFAKRVFHLLEALARRHDVTLLSYSDGDDAESVRVLEQLCTVRTVPAPAFPLGKRLAQLRSLASPTSFQRLTVGTPQMQQALDDLASGPPFDIIHVATSQLAGFRFDPRSVLVLDEHNIEYELYYRTYQLERSPLRRFFSWLEYAKFKREEIATWRAASGCAMTSRREAELVQRAVPGAPVAVVPNAVDTDFFAPGSGPVDPEAIVLTGLMKYRPNVDGAMFFVREILPRILRVRPTATFYVVGGEPAPEVLRLAGPNVVVTGGVDDVRPYVHKAAVFVVPLRVGSGTRLKVLEGLSMGKAMVSTALGCEGIDVTDGEHLLVADQAAPFAEAVLAVMHDPAMAQGLAERGRALMLERYRWVAAGEALEAFYARLMAMRGAVLHRDRGTGP